MKYFGSDTTWKSRWNLFKLRNLELLSWWPDNIIKDEDFECGIIEECAEYSFKVDDIIIGQNEDLDEHY